MSVNSSILLSLGICAVAAALEGLLAGKNVQQRLATLRHPSYALPLWGWYLTGALYYAICFVILYRLFRQETGMMVRNIALGLILVMMALNAFWNYLFFRMRNLFLSFIAFIPYAVIAVALFVCLLWIDKVAAWILTPYLLYLIYANLWSYGLWKLNPPSSPVTETQEF